MIVLNRFLDIVLKKILIESMLHIYGNKDLRMDQMMELWFVMIKQILMVNQLFIKILHH